MMLERDKEIERGKQLYTSTVSYRGGPGIVPPKPQFPHPPRKLENLYSLILMHDTVAVAHKLLPPHPHQNILYKP